ncbi:MAG: glycosyltransferase [Chitinophagaceae bacterium]
MNTSEKNIQPLVSVCVQTYQHAAFIAQCLDGILLQKVNFPFEIIIGEDESTDDTRKICLDYAEKYPGKISLFLRSRKDVVYIHGGPTGRYNFIKNLEAARGKYIAICEGDDYWTDENKLQRQFDFMEANPGYVICFHRILELNDDGVLIKSHSDWNEEKTFTINDLAAQNIIFTPSVFFRNGFIEKLPTWINESPVMDYVLHMFNARHGLIKYFPEPMAVYRKHGGGLWSTLPQEISHERWVNLLDLLLQENFDKSVKATLIAQKRHIMEKCLLGLMHEKTFPKFLEMLAKFSKADPYISEKWLLEYYPKYISGYTSSRSIQATKSVVLAIKKMLK